MIVARSTANCRLMLMPIDDNPAGRMASGNSREKLGHSGVAARHCTLYRRIAGYTVLKLAQLGPPDVRDLLEKRLHEVVTGTAGLYGASAKSQANETVGPYRARISALCASASARDPKPASCQPGIGGGASRSTKSG